MQATKAQVLSGPSVACLSSAVPDCARHRRGAGPGALPARSADHLDVTSLLLDAQNQTMVPAIAGYFNRETTTTDQVEAVAAAVSITAPLFLLVMVFQRQIVSGLTAGAVKG